LAIDPEAPLGPYNVTVTTSAGSGNGTFFVGPAGAVYLNDFENPATAFTGLTAHGTLTSLTRSSLPTDAGGLNSPNQSMWLGPLGKGVNKTPGTTETVALSLSGLTPGTPYSVSFDLLIGGSWDGSAAGFGPDEWRLTAVSADSASTLVDATFSNCGAKNELCGAGSPQSYSDATPIAVPNRNFAPGTGADVFNDFSGDYSQDYDIYYFGHGEGNPVPTFTPAASTAVLTFERLISSTDSADEYWALDNILVQPASVNPTPTSLSPSSVVAGTPTTTLTITSTNFIASSTVMLGATAVTIQSQTGTEPVVSVPAALLTTAGPVTVTVTNPAPGGGSANQQFTIEPVIGPPNLDNDRPGNRNTGTGGFSSIDYWNKLRRWKYFSEFLPAAEVSETPGIPVVVTSSTSLIAGFTVAVNAATRAYKSV
jgi:hypothetical protein